MGAARSTFAAMSSTTSTSSTPCLPGLLYPDFGTGGNSSAIPQLSLQIGELFSAGNLPLEVVAGKSSMPHKKSEAGYKCQDCSLVCRSSQSLEEHMRTHTGERPFACTVCAYRSAQEGNLRRHMLTHTGERPYSCTQCSYKARFKNNLNRHIVSKHMPANKSADVERTGSNSIF